MNDGKLQRKVLKSLSFFFTILQLCARMSNIKQTLELSNLFIHYKKLGRNNMKRALLMVCSICLVLACLFGLFACVAGMKDALNIQEYKQEDADHAREGIATARDGIKQLQENEDVYLNGVGTYEAGLIELSSGKSALNAGYKEYYAGKKALEEGKKAYAEGVKALEAGKKEYEAGKKKIADNTQAYNEGKEKLAKIEPLMPYLNQYVEFRDGTIAKLPGFDNAQVWFVKTVRPIAAQLGITIPDDVTDFPAFMNKMVADGKAQLKEYEDGVAKLAEAEKTIAAGEKKLAAAEKEIAAGEKKLADAEKQLAAGEKKLAAGKNELAAGDAKLSVYEGGQEQLAAGMQQLLDELGPCTTRSGVAASSSILTPAQSSATRQSTTSRSRKLTSRVSFTPASQ